MDEGTKRLKILERTFGLEMEYADVDKHNSVLPNGFEWDKVETIHNTDGTVGTWSGRYGGEINTVPMYFNHDSKKLLKELLTTLCANGAVSRRDLALQVHIYIGDLDVESVKNIFFLCYYTSEILKEVCYEPPYSDEQRYRPSPTLQYYQRIKEVKDFQGLRQVLENSSNKGWVRHFVNISSYFVRGTVEFRLFNSTTDYCKLLNCILFAYRFVNYALTHQEEDFRNIKNRNDFEREIKAPTDLPALPPALLYFSSIKDQDRGNLYHKALDTSKPLLSVLSDNIGEEISCVNPLLYSVEVRLSKNKRVSIYNNDEFHHIIYQIVKCGLRIEYTSKATFLQGFNSDNPINQVACLLIMHKLKKFFRDDEYSIANLEAYKSEMDVTFPKALEVSKNICALLETSTYKLGTLNNALNDGGEVFFQFDDYRKHRTTVGVLKKNSNYTGSFQKQRTQYNGIPASIGQASSLCMVSTNPYLPLLKIAQVGDKYFYKTDKRDTKISLKTEKNEILSFPEPPNDLQISDLSLLKICPVKSSILKQTQDAYIKKVEKTSRCRFAYLVFYDKYLIGGFGFDYPKMQEYDIWLLSDFCTNNAIPRLSKLILLIIKSKVVQQSVSRKIHMATFTCYTKVYTHAPVSMKYRGVFDKVSKEDNHLLYAAKLGSSGSMEDVFKKYQSYLTNKK